MKKLKIHMMGISGSGMSGVASLASKMGYTVTGCDLKTDGHNKKHLDGVDLLIVSPAVLYSESPDPELLLGKSKNMVTTWEEFLGTTLTKNKRIIAIAGTHGKSTTTGMVGKLLEDNGFDPLVMIGANVKSWSGSSRYGKGDYFVVEADEFNDNFLHYNPEIIILNNIEFDHPDYFDSEKQLFESFHKFVNKLVGESVLIANWDNEGVRNLIERLDLNKIKLVKYSRELKEINYTLKVLGDHNVTNALGVIELGKILGINEEKIIQSLENFEGIDRRMEEIGKNIFDDYAHHPTAIRTTLAGVRNKYPNAKIWAIIEPHGFLRTKALLTFYKDAFVSVDKVIIGPIFKARDKETFEMTPEKIKEISNHKNIYTANSIDQIIEIIKEKKENNDLFVVMGAGNSNIWAKKISEILHR
jgi:UDP-N-acetylmuramate--alanine ligase